MDLLDKLAPVTVNPEDFGLENHLMWEIEDGNGRHVLHVCTMLEALVY